MAEDNDDDDGEFVSHSWFKKYVSTEIRGAQKRAEMLFNERDRQYAQRFESQEKAVNAALVAAKEAVTKAEIASEKRFDAVNEFRGQLKDQQATLFTRAEADIRFRSLDEKIANLESRVASGSGALLGINWMWGALIAVATILAIIFFPR
jgi:hypothetical protein